MARGKDTIRNAGHRATSQRMLLLEIVRNSDGHMDADELHRLAQQKYPRISLSTIYRNLQVFKELGLVKDHGFSEHHRHYEVKARSEHHHLACQECGKIVEFSSPLIRKMLKQTEKEQGFTIGNADIHLTGICPACLSRTGDTEE